MEVAAKLTGNKRTFGQRGDKNDPFADTDIQHFRSYDDSVDKKRNKEE